MIYTKIITGSRNAQSIVVVFDGIKPLPPTYCYLKPDFLPITMNWFEQERIDFKPERIPQQYLESEVTREF